MSWRNKALEISRFGRIALAFGLAGLCAGCFQPLYGSTSPVDGGNVKDRLASVAGAGRSRRRTAPPSPGSASKSATR